MNPPLEMAPGARKHLVWPLAGYLYTGDSLVQQHTVTPGPGVSVVSSAVSGTSVVALVEMSAGAVLGARTWADLSFTTTLGEKDTVRYPLLCTLERRPG